MRPNLLLVQSWLPDYPAFDGLNPPSWSLCCEVTFYALFPVLLKFVNKIQARRLWWSAGGVFAFLLVMPSVATLLPMHPMLATMTIGLVLAVGAGATADLSKRASALRGPRMLWLSEVSFSFYLVHVLVLTYGHRALGGGAWSTPVALAVGAPLFAVALVVAAILHRFVEYRP